MSYMVLHLENLNHESQANLVISKPVVTRATWTGLRIVVQLTKLWLRVTVHVQMTMEHWLHDPVKDFPNNVMQHL